MTIENGAIKSADTKGNVITLVKGLYRPNSASILIAKILDINISEMLYFRCSYKCCLY